MKYAILIALLILAVASCKKESTTKRLLFSTEERKWFIYQNGQSIKFKNALGDSVVYHTTNVRTEFRPEYKDPFTNPVEIGTTEFYAAELRSMTDSIFIYFYKEFQYNSDPNRLRHTIRWLSILGQFVELDAVQNRTPFTTQTINNITYNTVTKASPISQTSFPFTMWARATYDQQFGFIELIDTNGNSWLRQ